MWFLRFFNCNIRLFIGVGLLVIKFFVSKIKFGLILLVIAIVLVSNYLDSCFLL